VKRHVPEEILSSEASPDVWSYSTTDEEFFYTVPYEIVDLILYAREKNLSLMEIKKLSNLPEEKIQNLLRFQDIKQRKSQHMRDLPYSWTPNFI